MPVSADEMLVKMWLHNRPRSTAEAYRRDVMAYLARGVSVEATTLADIQAWDADMERAGRAASYRARRIAALTGMFRFAKEEGIITNDPSVRMKVRRVAQRGIERIAPEQDVVRMIAAEPSPRHRVALRMLYALGLRASELCGLRWADMTPGTKRAKAEARIVGKGEKLRIAPIEPDVWAEIAALTPKPAPTDPVVPGRDGRPLNHASLHRIVKRAAKRVGMPTQFSAHWLRHSTATHALNNGCPIQVVQARLGHASLETTTRYAHTRADQGLGAFIKG